MDFILKFESVCVCVCVYVCVYVSDACVKPKPLNKGWKVGHGYHPVPIFPPGPSNHCSEQGCLPAGAHLSAVSYSTLPVSPPAPLPPLPASLFSEVEKVG